MMDSRNAYGFPLETYPGWMNSHGENRNSEMACFQHGSFDAAFDNDNRRTRMVLMQEALANCFSPRQITKLQRAQAIAKEVCARRFPVKRLDCPLEE